MINKRTFGFCNLFIVLGLIITVLCSNFPAKALKLPVSLRDSAAKILPIARVRIDGGIETTTGALYLPSLPTQVNQDNKEISLKAVIPNKGTADFLLFNNGWCFLRVLSRGRQTTVVQLTELSRDSQKALLSTKFASDLIVPERFVLPASMKIIGATVGIPVEEAKENAKTEVKTTNIKTTVIDVATKSGATKPSTIKSGITKPTETNKNIEGWILVTSPTTGKVSLLSYPALIKIIEFPMEGTPSGIAYANGKVYITDQSKSRILKLDPYQKMFLGQIDLPPHSAPKDVVALPGGKLIYVSESTLNDVAVFETDTDKLLVRTKVHSYPGRMAITPNGNCLIVLSVPDGKVSLVSTRNQRFLGAIAVGSLPHGIAITANSRIAYISNRVSNTISIIDLLQQVVVSTLKTGLAPTGMAIDYEHNRLYVVNAKDNSISIYDLVGTKKTEDIKLPMDLDFPGSLTMLPDNKHMLVSSASTDGLGLFDISTQTFEKITALGHNSDKCIWVPMHEE